MPQEMLEGNPWDKGTKTRVKEWVKDNVGRRGSDIILWGRWKHNDEEGEGGEAIGKKTGVLLTSTDLLLTSTDSLLTSTDSLPTSIDSLLTLYRLLLTLY